MTVKKLFTLMVIISALLMVSTSAFAIDESVTIGWEQECIDGCPEQDLGPVEEWRIYLSDTSGVYGPTPIITITYDGTPQLTYSSDYILTLTGAGTKYCIIRSWNTAGGESGDSVEASYDYNFAGSAVPVRVTFGVTPAQ